ncbi:MAG: sensor histidine kinase [Bacteroidia bacterium]
MKILSIFKSRKTTKQTDESELQFWRRSLFDKVLYIFFVSALIIVVPSAWGSFAFGVPIIGYFDIIAFVLIAFFHFSPSLFPAFREKAVELIYLIGVFVIIFLGPQGAGFIWLICYSTFSTIIFGKKGAIRSYTLILIALVIIGLELEFSFYPNLKIHGYTTVSFALTSFNALAVLLMINVAFNFLINRLQTLFLKQKEIADKYKEKSIALKQSNDNLDNLVYSISHDIRSPLANIKGLATLGRLDSDSIKIEDYFKKIEKSSDRLQEFTIQVTEFFKIEKTDPKYQNIELKHFINELYTYNFQSQFTNNQTFVNEIPENTIVLSDKTRLSQILINLFSNSIKYKSENRPLLIEVSSASNNGFIDLYFKDNGIGISADFMPLIWEIFSRGSKKSQGAGLGLYIVNQCAVSINAKINVESVQGAYTKFTLSIPT